MESNWLSRWVHLRAACVAVMFLSTPHGPAAEAPPAIQWQASFGGSGSDSCRSVVPTSDRGFVLSGRSTSGASGNKTSGNYGSGDLWLVKINAEGNKVWDKTFGGSKDDGFYYSALAATPDGGFLLGADSDSGVSGNKTSVNYGRRDIWLVKVDASGNKLWDNSFGGNADADPGGIDYDVLFTIVSTDDGGALLGGVSNCGISGDKTSPHYGGFDLWLVKVDAGGNKLWDRSFGGSGDEGDVGTGFLPCVSIVPSGDGGFLIGGPSSSGVSGNKTSSNYGDFDYWLIRIDADGNKLWERSFGGSRRDFFTSIARTTDGGFLLGGESQSGISGNKTSANYGSTDYWVVKVDAAGEKLWERTFGGSEGESLYSIAVTDDGGFLLGGSRWIDVDFWVVNLDASGTRLWEQSFGAPFTGATGNEVLRAVLSTEDGGFLLGGRSNSGVSGTKTSPNYGGEDFWVIKLEGSPRRLAIQPSAIGAVALNWDPSLPLRLQKTPRLTNPAWETVSSGDSGTIELPATGASGFFRLLRVHPLEIQVPPQRQTVHVGSNVVFSVAARGTGDLVYQWYKDTLQIPGATNQTLFLANVQIADEGAYSVRVSDEQNTLLSSEATLSVLMRPTITQQPQSQTVNVGDTVSFSVSMEGHPPPFGYRWRRGGVLLTNMVSSERTSTFTLFNVQTNHAGNYDCIVTNAAFYQPGVRSSNAVLTIRQP